MSAVWIKNFPVQSALVAERRIKSAEVEILNAVAVLVPSPDPAA
jgi:hypothetical protein